MKEKENRVLWIDYLRFIACFLVIMVHVPEVGEGNYEKIYTYVSRIAVPIFFMMSGFLTLPFNYDLDKLFSKRLSRLLYPFIFWGVIYAFVPFFYGEIDFKSVVLRILMMPLKLTASHLWYMYSIIGLTLIAPIISPWLKNAKDRDLKYFLILWFITLFFPYINLIDSSIQMDEWNGLYTLYYFSGYLGYYILGYYIKNHEIKISKNKYNILFISILVFNFLIVFLLLRYTKASLEITRYLTINVAMFSLSVFMIVKEIKFYKGKLYAIILEVSKKSFGIYLAHELILRRLVFPLFEKQPFYNLFSRPVMAILILVISYLFVFCISKLPNSKYLIG